MDNCPAMLEKIASTTESLTQKPADMDATLSYHGDQMEALDDMCSHL